MASSAHTGRRACHTWSSGNRDGLQLSQTMSDTLEMASLRREDLGSRQKEPPVTDPALPIPKQRRKCGGERRTVPSKAWRSTSMLVSTSNSIRTMIILTILALLLPTVDAVFLRFENCLNYTDPQLLQFTPLFLSARFNTTSPEHNLNVTIYGNVSGQTLQGDYPPPTDPSWSNPNDTFGKIVNVSDSTNTFTTLDSTIRVLTYTPYSGQSPFCASVLNGTCPLGPSFNGSREDPYGLSTFTLAKDLNSSYAFSSFAGTFMILSGDQGARTLGCISASITPDLGGLLSNMLRYLPAVILALVATATIVAATLSPWGTSDLFRWTSNYGRDEDLLRLVTPGFGDCLQYIQFIVLSGSLTLAYPGFYQPVVSKASWSTLMFNQSFVSHGPGYSAVQDGIYHVNQSYGLSMMGQYVGMTEERDIWAGMAVFLLGLTLCVMLLCQFGFISRWTLRTLSNDSDQDLRSKNWPFTAGMIIRLLFNYFLLPLVALSLYQMVVAPRSPASVVIPAAILLVCIFGFAAWIFRLIFNTRPRAHLFDDLPTLLQYGPLFNTYSDDAAPFAFIPVFITFMRGIAIGAVQPSGIAQLVILAICEVILILTVHAFRPFQANTSMNAYHTFFAIIRLVTTMLSVAFVPSLGVTEGPKGWFGYIILLLHAIVLIFGFFLNALQTLIEVFARLAGAGDARGGLTKVFGMRQLSRRAQHRKQRSSLNSQAAILTHEQDQKAGQHVESGRSRSMSASSAVLLNSQGGRISAAFDQFSQGGDYSVGGRSSGTGTPGGATSPYTFLPSGSGSAGPSSRRTTVGPKIGEPVGPYYYRPPRMRRPTLEPFTPGDKSRGSWMSTDQSAKPYKDSPEQAELENFGDAPPFASNRGSITPAYLRALREDSDLNLAERRNTTDYAVREADLYYGVGRGPALSNLPTRRLKTGPADPMGPVASATSWFKGLGIFTGKRKDKGKGFEVVRSTRVPPQMMPLEDVDVSSPPLDSEPYRDSPIDGEEGGAAMQREATHHTVRSDSDSRSDFSDDDSDPFDLEIHRVSDMPPSLGPIESVGGIDLPSRVGSQVSRRLSRGKSASSGAPRVPRKSSRRSRDSTGLMQSARLSTVAASPPTSPMRDSLSGTNIPQYQHDNALHVRMPFSDGDPSPSPERSGGASAASSIFPAGESSGGPGIRGESERPMSTGYVQHYLAGERIQPGVYDINSNLGTEAELVDLSTTRSRSADRSNN